MDESSLVGKEPCPKCGSRNNLARYSDGHAYCFSPGCEYYEHGDGTTREHNGRPRMAADLISGGEFKPLAKRDVTEETARKFGYRYAEFNGKKVQVADYRDQQGQIVAQHLRFPNKDFVWLGESKNVQLFGQHLWGEGGKKVVITEGEIDALSVSQLQGNKWPVVSIPSGAASAKKAISANLSWLASFDEVILMFDMDEPGQKAVQECAPLLPPGKCKIASLPLKDANDCLVQGKGQDVITAIWNAKTFRPDGIKKLSDIKAEVLKPVEMGRPWPFPELTKLTYGRRMGEVYMFGAGTGIGKTDLFTQTIAYILEEERKPVACFYLEQPIVETGKRIAGKIAKRRFHVPDAGWTQEELLATFDKLEEDDNLFLYDHFGSTDWDNIASTIRYLAHAEWVQDFFIDHLTALADPSNEKESLEQLMKEMASLAQELKVSFYVISHLSTPEGKPHEEGGRVMIRHFKGSRAIGFWSHYMFGMERDQQHPDERWRSITTFRVLKDRYTGTAAGQCLYLGYDKDTGMLSVVEPPADEPDAKDHGFHDEDVPF